MDSLSAAPRKIRSLGLALGCGAMLAACGSGEGSAPSTKAPAAAEPTEAEKQALLASLPSPYNTADLENGRRVFARCRSCHTLTPNGPNMTGPNLHGLFGREVGSHDKFRYSNALKDADFVWDAHNLDQWLLRPRDFLPGNKMSFVGVAGDDDRRDVIAYLKVETGYKPQSPEPATAPAPAPAPAPTQGQ